MVANVYVTELEPMFYSLRAPAWHALRLPSMVEKPAVNVIDEDFQGAFTIENRPVTVTLNGQPTETGDYGIVRCSSKADPKEVVFGYCSEHYHPLQPRDAAEIFDNNVCVPVETLAFLGKGETMFISWEMGGFDVVSDPVKMFGIVWTGFDTDHGTKLFTSTVRPVCQNTITMAESWAKRNTNKAENKGMIWKGKGTNRNLGRDLGYWMEHVQTRANIQAGLIESLFSRLAKTPIKNDAEVENILLSVYPDKVDNSESVPWQLRSERQKAIASANDATRNIRDGIFGLFGGRGTAITPDYWGMLNATSEYFCHYQPSKKAVAESIMFGKRSDNIMAMVEELNKRSA